MSAGVSRRLFGVDAPLADTPPARNNSSASEDELARSQSETRYVILEPLSRTAHALEAAAARFFYESEE